MEPMEKEKIRETVREAYGKIARENVTSADLGPATSCCGPSDGCSGVKQTTSCCGPQTASSVEIMSNIMGYSDQDMAEIPEGANMGLGCGNPVAIASLQPGETVVDLGSGGGFDCFLAAKKVGETGRVIGVDMTPDMISKARKNAEKMGTDHVEFRLGEIEHLPVADDTADIVLSNCVINLSPDKLSVYKDVYRVLKPGGRLAISDIVTTAKLPEEIRNDLALVSACIGGAATIYDTEKLLQEVGFQEITIQPNDKSQQLIQTWNPDKDRRQGGSILSAYIEAKKPS